ncbi:DUF4013 domain-containing protein [Rubellicoccus peritrichatus]|uniref:DUF4013 domain-containing protein n=1 Tax=Rubellicoccus peritrichatus TaxID=3080537 RepID=A0AAQ3L5K9_9BACT|nr:DUF4013 domain-containing protein [Puniceicoccus sp. CR14]WOO39854.1 DUF4013 domain-containing protein [Puniceicoccus sp. CR14]
MATIDSVCERIFSAEGSWRRLLFGGLLCLSIIGIPFAAGYLFHYAASLRSGDRVELPPWGEWTKRFIAGLHFLGVFAVWYLLVLFLGFVFGWLIEAVTLGLLWWAGYVITMLASAAAPAFFASALNEYLKRESWSALKDISAILVPIRSHWIALLLPGAAWIGLLTIALPLLPFAFFLGFTALLAYYIPLFAGQNR